MKERLKQIRNEMNLSQETFGKRLGVTKSAISRLEKGINSITDRMIASICREFNLNEEWFRYGTGEKRNTNKKDSSAEINRIVSEIYAGNDQLRISILSLAAKLVQDDYCWNIIETQLLQMINIEKSVASYRNELEAETKPLEKLGALQTTKGKIG